MSYDQLTAERVRRALSNEEAVEKRMVGGVSFLVNGKMCCGVMSNGLMVRVGAKAMSQTLSEPYAGPVVFGRRRLKGFVLVEPEGYRTNAALLKWLRRALHLTGALAAKPRPRKVRETKPTEAVFAEVVGRLSGQPDVADWKGFGGRGLRVNGRLFTMMSSRGQFVVKLPRERVDALVELGAATRFNPTGRGRLMKEWAALHRDSSFWLELARESYAFVRKSAVQENNGPTPRWAT